MFRALILDMLVRSHSNETKMDVRSHFLLSSVWGAIVQSDGTEIALWALCAHSTRINAAVVAFVRSPIHTSEYTHTYFMFIFSF